MKQGHLIPAKGNVGPRGGAEGGTGIGVQYFEVEDGLWRQHLAALSSIEFSSASGCDSYFLTNFRVSNLNAKLTVC